MGNSVAYTVEMPTVPASSSSVLQPSIKPTSQWTNATKAYQNRSVDNMVLALNRKSRIAFASCNDQDHQNNLWPIIQAREPAAFIWGGDAIYADTQGDLDWSVFPPTHRHECATPERLRSLYEKQRNNPGYRKLVESNITIFGTFDDHDYGCNNADRTYPHKYESGLAFVDFIDAPSDSAMRGRVENGKGVYGVKVFDFARPKGDEEVPEIEANIDADISTGSPAILSNQSVAIFVLDVRTWKTPWKTSFEKYFPDFEGDYLGEEQWLWFENSIRRSNAAVNVIVNGLQVHAHRFLDGNTAESWSQYPRAQQRLFDAILQDSVRSPILISGDVHMTQLMRKDCARQGDHRPVRSLLEFTTSGMTHSWGGISSPLGELDYQPTLTQRLHSFTGISLISILHKICPWTDLMFSEDTHTENGGNEGSIQGLQYSLDVNFGELEFDWNERSVTFRSLGEQPNAPPLLAAKVYMDQLSGTSSMSKYYLSSDDFERESQSWLYQQRIAGNSNSEWICINHRGRDTVIQHLVGHAISAAVLLTVFPLPLYLFIIIIFRGFRHWNSSDKARTQRKENLKSMKKLPKRAAKKKAVFVYTRTIHRSSRRWKLGLRILGNSAWCENGQQIISAEVAEDRPHRNM